MSNWSKNVKRVKYCQNSKTGLTKRLSWSDQLISYIRWDQLICLANQLKYIMTYLKRLKHKYSKVWIDGWMDGQTQIWKSRAPMELKFKNIKMLKKSYFFHNYEWKYIFLKIRKLHNLFGQCIGTAVRNLD